LWFSSGAALKEIAYKEIALPIISAINPVAVLLGDSKAAPKAVPETI
jgi:hypothetical protein